MPVKFQLYDSKGAIEKIDFGITQAGYPNQLRLEVVNVGDVQAEETIVKFFRNKCLTCNKYLGIDEVDSHRQELHDLTVEEVTEIELMKQLPVVIRPHVKIPLELMWQPSLVAQQGLKGTFAVFECKVYAE